MKDLTPLEKLAVYALKANFSDALNFAGLKEHPLFTRDAWVAAVVANSTSESYRQFVVNNNNMLFEAIYDEIDNTPKAVPKKAIQNAAQELQSVKALPAVTTEELERMLGKWSESLDAGDAV